VTIGPASSAGQLAVKVVVDDTGLERDLTRKLDKATTAAVGSAGKTLDAGTSKLETFSERASSVGNKASLALTLPLVALGASATNAASDTIEALNKTRVVFGDAAGTVESFAETSAKSFGISRSEALSAAGTLGNLFRAMGAGEKVAAETSVELTKLAGDLASFNNADPTEVLDALRAGLVGEAEPLRRFGVSLSEARVEAEALATGLVKPVANAAKVRSAHLAVEEAVRAATAATKEHGAESLEARKAQEQLAAAETNLAEATKGNVPALTDEQKLMARRSIILKDTTLAQGDFARSLSTSQANQQRVSSALAKDAKATFGETLLPLVQRATVVLGGLASGFSELSPRAQTAFVVLAGGLAALGPVLKVSSNVATVYRALTGETTRRLIATVRLNAAVARLIVTEKLHAAATKARAVAERVAAVASRVAAAAARGLGIALRFATGPIGLAILAIAALVTGFVIAYKRSETFRKIVHGVLNAVAGAAKAFARAMAATFRVVVSVVKVAVDVIGKVLTVLRTIFSVAIALWLLPFVTAFKVAFAVVSVAIKVWLAYVRFAFNLAKTVVLAAVGVIRTVVVAVFNALKTVVLPIVGAIQTGVAFAFNVMRTLVVGYVTVMRTVVTAVFNAMKTAVLFVVNGLRVAIGAAFNVIRTVVTTYVNTIKAIVVRVFQAIAGPVGAALGVVKRVVVTIFDGIRTAISTAIGKVRDVVSGLVEILKTPFRVVLDGLRKLLRAIGRVKIKIPEVGIGPFKAGGQEFGFPDLSGLIPELAAGGIVPATPGGRIVKVAEAGADELVLPLTRERLTALGVGGGDTTIITNVYNPEREPASESVAKRLRRLAALGVTDAAAGAARA
jgi:phage-related protein